MMNETSQLIEAFLFAAQAHKEQRRKGNGGAPYINHLIEVVSLLSSTAKVDDTDILIAAALHDILEDTPITVTEITKRYGSNVLSYVQAVSDDKALTLIERRAKQLKSMNESSDPIKYIKLADHCSNIASLPPTWDKQRLKEYIGWSQSVAEKCFDVSEPLAVEYRKRYLVALRHIE
ncbi:hypothetical protein LCGC14_0950780 [marine sediment metagenome]|uniref:HD/PDEase domain-containing protein n=1 Tax=marine sediment metagenome TaxID=412755 RepID=A0A0F9R0T9_9ZZZZ|nr:bifunctional (p)ppGpp synthetase/guanosine-3',5'-bis(diphosphate) 3'-pyrophosphohydrolase [Methylophaga sp.]